MPILYVYGIRSDIDEDKLVRFWEGLRLATASVTELGLDPSQVTVFFPPDMLQESLGEEIIINIKSLFDRPERTDEARNRLCERLGLLTVTYFPDAWVEVIIDPPYDAKKGYWNKPK